MSLVNQMLQDLERRRTAEAGVSPLSGLSASGAGVLSGPSIHYLWLGVTLAAIFAAVFVLVFLFGRGPSLVAEPVMTQKTETRNIEPLAAAPVAAVAQPAVAPPPRATPREAAPIAVEQPSKPVTQVPPVTATVSAPVLAIIPHSDAAAEDGTVRITAATDQNPMPSSASTPLAAARNIPAVRRESQVAGQPQEQMQETQLQEQPEPVNKILRPLTLEQQAQQAFQQAVQLLGRGDEPGAEQALQRTLAVEPAHQRARETLSALLLNTGRVSEAADSLREGLRLQPATTALAKLYARVLVDQGDNAAAVAVLEQAPPTQAADTDYYALLAALYRAAGRHAQASQVYQQLLQARPGVAAWWMGLALSEDAMGAQPQALEAYRRAQRAGGLKAEVLDYVQSRIAALGVRVAETGSPTAAHDSDGFGD